MHGELRQIADLALFAKIVQTGGISRCASDLGMERSTISRRLGALERDLGVKLIDRSPKHMAVTDAGRRCLDHCEQLLEAAQRAQLLALSNTTLKQQNPIVLGAPADIIDRYIEPALQQFEAHTPGIKIERHPVSVWNDTAINNVDLGISLGPVAINDGWTNRIATVPQSIYASADYASKHRPMRSPLLVESHACIVEGSCSDSYSWRIRRKQEVASIIVNAKYIVSSVLEKREATLAGLGISRLPNYLCEPYVQAGRLVDMLPETELAGRDVLLLSPRKRQHKAGLAALRMQLENAFDF